MIFWGKLRFSAKLILMIGTSTGLCSCAGVTFYSDPNLQTKTGIPIYAPKPYLLIARTGAKDKPVDVSIVHLNDYQNVIYAKPRSGFGSSSLALALANGQLTSFGQQTDTKIPELITALGGIISTRATAAKTEAEAAQIRSGISTLQAAVSPVDAGINVDKVADEIQEKIKNKVALRGLTDSELQTVLSAAQALKSAATALLNPSNAPSASMYFEQVKAQADILSKLPTPTASTQRDSSLQIVQAWASELNKLFDSVQPEKKAPPTFELYEIKETGGTTKLLKIDP